MFLFFFSVLLGLLNAHECIHGQIHELHDQWTSPQRYKNHPYDKSIPEERRRLLPGTYESIRISPFYTLDGVSGETANYIKSITSAAIKYLEDTISVIRIDGSLEVSRWCSSRYDWNGYDNCVSWQDAGQQKCGLTVIPADHMSSEFTFSSWKSAASSFTQYSGVGDTDLIIYVTASDTNCGGSTLAYASRCVTDQYGRPIAGYINFCSNSLSSQNWINDVDTTLHEISHVVVVSPGLWDTFVDSNGDPIGTANTYDIVNNQKWIKTTNVLSKAQEFYNCYDTNYLRGLPIESDGGSGSSGAHWEEQYLATEFMGSTLYSGSMTYVSQFTLALMEDSGWYQVDYSKATGYWFGYQYGCTWWTGCGTASTNPFLYDEYRCSSSSDRGCSWDHRTTGGCVTYSSNSGGCYFRNGYVNTICADDYTNDYKCLDTGSSGRCFQMECSGTSSVTIYSGGNSIVCSSSEEGNQKSVGSYTITCPPLDVICATSDPFACAHGHWDDTTSACLCDPGWIGTDCSTEARTHVTEASPGSGYTYPSSVCVYGASTSGINGVYSHVGTHEFFPYYQFGSYYLYHLSWYHQWYISTTLGSATSYVDYCGAGEKEIDVTACSGLFTDSGISVSSSCNNNPSPIPSPTSNPTKKPTSKPTAKPTVSSDSSDGEAFLTWHNDERRKTAIGNMPCNTASTKCPKATNMVQLQWDPAIAKVATAWSTYLSQQCTIAHNSNRHTQTCQYEDEITFGHNCNNYQGTVSLGENVAMHSSQTIDAITVIAPWVDSESSQYVYGTDYQSGAGHFTQVVWASTTHIGCGCARSSCGTYCTCNYAPPGNYQGNAPYEDGSSICSNCPSGTTCSNHLCVASGDQGGVTTTTKKPTIKNEPTGNPTPRPTPSPIEPTPKPTSHPTGTTCGITTQGFSYSGFNDDWPVYMESYGIHSLPVYGPSTNGFAIYYHSSGAWFLVSSINDITTGGGYSGLYTSCSKDAGLPITACEGSDWNKYANSVIITSDCGTDPTDDPSDTSTDGIRANNFGYSGFNGYYPTFKDSYGSAGRPIYGPNSNNYFFHFNSYYKAWMLTSGGDSITDGGSYSGLYSYCQQDTSITECSGTSWSNYGSSTTTLYKSATFTFSSNKNSNNGSDIGIGIVIGISIMIGISLFGCLIWYFMQKSKDTSKFNVVDTQTTTPYVAMTHN